MLASTSKPTLGGCGCCRGGACRVHMRMMSPKGLTALRKPLRSLRILAAAQPIDPSTMDREQSRIYRRVAFDFDRWSNHRSQDRYLNNIKSMPSSRILRSLSFPLLYIASVSTAFCFYEQAVEAHLLPEYMPKLALNPGPLGLTSFALSLLLVFRTNSSYGRFDEARKIWGGILNRARDIVQQATIFFPDGDAASRQALARWTIGFCRALNAHLQKDIILSEKLNNVLMPHELEMLLAADHRPIFALAVLSEITKQVPMDTFQQLQMRDNITFFYDALGGCERIFRTPIPLSYTRHTSRFMLIWLTLLPLSLWQTCGWSCIFIDLMTGLLLLGIDEIGVQIEEPFGILPIDAICNTAENNAKMLLLKEEAIRESITSVVPISKGNSSSAQIASSISQPQRQLQTISASASSSNGNSNSNSTSPSINPFWSKVLS